MNECEHVIVVDVCCTIKRPTTMCLAKKYNKKNKKITRQLKTTTNKQKQKQI